MARPSYPALRWLAIDAARADGHPAPSGSESRTVSAACASALGRFE